MIMSSSPFDHLPVIDPGKPDLTSVPRFLWWIGKKQSRIVLTGTFFGILNLLCVALMPGVLGRGIQAIADENQTELRRWVLAALSLGVLQAAAGILRHRRAVGSWISAATRLQQLVARKAVHLGADLPRLVSTGEVSAINSNDVERVARVYDLIPRLSGAIISFLFVSIILISSSPTLGLMVVIGVPLLGLVIGPIIKPLQNRESVQREKLSISSGLAADGGNLVSQGELKVGELLSFYGYSAFLMIPLQILTESAQRLTSGTVAARRVMKLLSVDSVQQWGEREFPKDFSLLEDTKSGLVISKGIFLGVVSDNSLNADEMVDRLGGYLDANTVLIDGMPLAKIQRDSIRANIYAQEKEPAILSGTIESLFKVAASGRLQIAEAIESASASDILESLEGDGYSAEVVERGRTLSGGQRQRLALARTLYVDAPIVILDEPTSAVDTHTEARIAQRLKAIRGSQTTIAVTNSPLILDYTDEVALIVDGKVAARGTHHELIKKNEVYRRLVVRGQ